MIHELENLQGAPGTKRAGARRRIVDELGALQMDATRAEIADFESGFAAQALLDRRAPLLDILCGSMGIEGRKADRGRAENGGIEVEGRLGLGGVQQRSRRIEIVELLGFRKNKGNVVALIAPGIQVHRGKENAVRAVENESQVREIAGNAEARSEVVLVRIEQPVGIAVLSANENLGRAALESKVRVGIGDVVQRPGVFVAQAHFDGRRAGKLEAVLEEALGRPRAKLHLRNAGLALLHGGQTEQETGEGGSAAVVCAGSRRVAARELVVAAILEEAPHRPDIVAKTAAEVQTVTAALPTEGIAALDGGVPSAHRRGGVGIAHAGITLHVKPRRPPGTRPAKAYAQNTQLRNDVVGVGALRKVAHGQARKGHRGDVYQVRRDNAVPGHAALLGKIVVAGAKAREVNGHESALGTERIPRRKRARGRENLVDAGRALVVDVMFVAHVEIIVAIDAV